MWGYDKALRDEDEITSPFVQFTVVKNITTENTEENILISFPRRSGGTRGDLASWHRTVWIF